MCSETTNAVRIRSNYDAIEQLQRDGKMLANMVMSQQVAIARMQARLNEQDAIIALLCREQGIMPKEMTNSSQKRTQR
jgi:hypothetical protein